MQGKYLVHSVRNDSKPREGKTAPGDVSSAVSRMVHQVARRVARADNA